MARLSSLDIPVATHDGIQSLLDSPRVLPVEAHRHAAQRATTLGVGTVPSLVGLRDGHRVNLSIHRDRYGFKV
jgi:hypothetical protein